VNCGISLNAESSVAGSSRSLNRNACSPVSTGTDDPTFWVPSTTHGVLRQSSVGQSDQHHSGKVHELVIRVQI
jgi:hypothetical protein